MNDKTRLQEVHIRMTELRKEIEKMSDELRKIVSEVNGWQEFEKGLPIQEKNVLHTLITWGE